METASCWVDGLTIEAALRQTARRFGSREALVFPKFGTRLSWAQLDEVVDQLRPRSVDTGLSPGRPFWRVVR